MQQRGKGEKAGAHPRSAGRVMVPGRTKGSVSGFQSSGFTEPVAVRSFCMYRASSGCGAERSSPTNRVAHLNSKPSGE